MNLIQKLVPDLKKGDWWIIETTFIVSTSKVKHGPEELGEQKYSHKYEIVEQNNIDGHDVLVIDIKAIDLPASIENAHGDNYLWRLYLNKDDLSLVRLIMNIRSGNYLVTGPEVIKRTFDYKNGNPVVVSNIPVLTPLDIPKLPSEEFPRYLAEEEKELEYLDEQTYEEFIQSLVVIKQDIDGKQVPVLYLTISNEELGIRTQKWIPGLPWWQEWRMTKSDRFINGMWYAKLIKWGTI